MKKIFSTLSILLLALYSLFAQADFYTHPDWAKSANIYEVNIRQYTKEGTFKAFEKQLPRLKKMGVNILWLMPIFPIGEAQRKGSLGSYYAVKDYRAVNPEFGTLADLKALVKDAHDMGFKVILDWVANHSAPDNVLTKDHPNWYKHDSVTGKIIPPVADWGDVSGFNYANHDLWVYQIECMKYWIKEADVDGFRCDVAMMVPLEFWKRVRTELDKVKKVFMLAEGEGPEFHRNGFDMTYTWDLHHLLNQVAKGEKKAADIKKYMIHTDSIYQKDDYLMNFTSNHDENSWNGSEYERMGDAAKALAVLCATMPGMPLVYTGQESGLAKRLKFFDKDTIDWKKFPLADFYKTLLTAKTQHASLWNGSDGGSVEFITTGNPDVLAFIRKRDKDKLLVVINLSDKKQSSHYAVNRKLTDIFNGKALELSGLNSARMEPWGYGVYVIN